MAWVITEACVHEKIAHCVSVCPENCIQTSDEANQYFINPDQCTDCGLCDLACPVAAIFNEHDVPLQWSAYTELNKHFFNERR